MSGDVLSFTPEFILANFEGDYQHPVRHRVCAECNCKQIFLEHQFEPSGIKSNYGDFMGGRIIQPVEFVIGKITLESTINRWEFQGKVIEYEINFNDQPTVNGKRLRVDWEEEITSGLREGHRVDLDFRLNGEMMTISFLSLGESLVCGDCKKIQPENQPPLSQEFWNQIVEKGAPRFYKKNLKEIRAEMEENNWNYRDIFSHHDADPWECELECEDEENLRNIMHILYDQVRVISFELKEERDKIFRANFNHWRKQLPIKINAWRISLKLSVIDIHFINLYLFENESEFKLKQDERKKLLSDCKLLV